VEVIASGFLPAVGHLQLGQLIVATLASLDEDRGLHLPAPALGLGRGHVAMVLFPADHAGDQVFVAFGQCQAAASDASQQILVALARRGVRVQATLQANLRRSADDWPRLVEAGLGIRLVKGAYVEPERVAHRYGPPTDDAYRRLARSLRTAGARVTLATHDAALRDGLLAELGPMDVEMLLGVRPEDHALLLARGVTPRLYVPYGRDWFRNWMRRVAESQGAG